MNREDLYRYFEVLTPTERVFQYLYQHPEITLQEDEQQRQIQGMYQQWKAEYQTEPGFEKLESCSKDVRFSGDLKTAHQRMQLEMEDALELENSIQNMKIVRHTRYLNCGYHSHRFIEISYVYSGSCLHVFRTENGEETIRLMPGELVIIPPGIHHKVAVYNDGVMLNILVNVTTFRDVFMQNLIGNEVLFEFFGGIIWDEKQKSPMLVHTGKDEDVKNVLTDLVIRYVQDHPYSREICDHLLGVWLLTILPYCMNEMELYGREGKDRKLVVAIGDYLQKNYLTATLDDVAEEFHYSSTHINDVLKKYTGTTVGKQIRNLRVEKACELLRYSSLSVEEIADRVGYKDTSYFIEQFKKIKGVTPLKYRRQMP